MKAQKLTKDELKNLNLSILKYLFNDCLPVNASTILDNILAIKNILLISNDETISKIKPNFEKLNLAIKEKFAVALKNKDIPFMSGVNSEIYSKVLLTLEKDIKSIIYKTSQ